MKGLYNPRPVDDTPVNGQLAHGVTSNWAFDHAADLDAHTRNALEKLKTGRYHTFLGGYSDTDNLTADRLTSVPIVVPRNMTIDRIAVDVTAQAGQKIRLGIYNDGTNLYPGTLLLDAGEITLSGTGVNAITIDQALTKGVYWLAIISDGTPTVRSWNPFRGEPTVLGRDTASFNYRVANAYKADSYGALPDPFPASGSQNGLEPVTMAVRIASLD